MALTRIYFIGAGKRGPIKIGVAGDPRKRLKTLQVAHYERLALLLTIRADDELERVLHKRFKRGHLRGEWFDRDTPGLLELISDALRDELPIWVTRHIRDDVLEAVV